MLKNRVQILEGALEAFFKGMLAGYAGDGEGSTKATTDGYKTIEFVVGDYKVVDRYCVNPHSDHSAGTTTIFYKETPVWWMCYAGWYEKSVISFLKRVLLGTYQTKSFNLGRGLKQYQEKAGDRKFTYRCIDTTTCGSSFFNEFEGFDEITVLHTLSGVENRLGFHRVMGRALI